MRLPGPDRWHLHPATFVTAGLLVVAGVMFAASAVAGRSGDLRPDRATGLRDLARVEAQRVADLGAEVAALQVSVDELLAADEAGPALEQARQRVEDLGMAAGTTAVIGPSVTVALDDAPKLEPGSPLEGNVTPDDLVVHQQDVQAVVNALWTGGAEAMQIMDQRVVATSAVRCVGNTLILQGRVYSPPFTVTAIGDPERLQAALDDDAGVRLYREWANVVGLGYEVTSAEGTVLPAYAGPVTTRWATAVRP